MIHLKAERLVLRRGSAWRDHEQPDRDHEPYGLADHAHSLPFALVRASHTGDRLALARFAVGRLRPLFDIAISADPTLLVKLPSLATLPGARTAIAQKAVATRQRNKQSKARGEPQTHGKVGKTRKRAEEKAALETLQEQQQQSSVPATGATAGQTAQPVQTSVTPAPAPVVTTPVATGTSPVVSATSAVPAVTNGVNGIANGAAH